MRARAFLLVLVLVACAVLSGSASPYKTYESITVANTAIGLAAATIDPPGRPPMNRCSGRLETAEIRFRYDGTDPTSAEGQVLEPLEVLNINDHEDARALKMIRTGGTSGTIKFVCWAQ